MSDQPQGPSWWQASDGKWYPPQPAPTVGDRWGAPQQPQPSGGGGTPIWVWMLLIAGAGFIALIVGLVIVAGGTDEADDADSAPATALSPTTTTPDANASGSTTPPTDITYEVVGTASTVSVTYSDGNLNLAQEASVPVPWSLTIPAAEGFTVYSLLAQNQGQSGDVTCRILRGDELLTEVTSQGGFTVASCTAP